MAIPENNTANSKVGSSRCAHVNYSKMLPCMSFRGDCWNFHVLHSLAKKDNSKLKSNKSNKVSQEQGSIQNEET